jgi:hypothetical protein
MRSKELHFPAESGFISVMKSILFFLALCLLAVPTVEAMSRKAKFSISFHSQGAEHESPRSIFRYAVPGSDQAMIFRKVAEFSHNEVAAFHSFPAPSGNGNGITLRLDFRGSNALELLTRTRQGEIVLALVNGQPVDYLTIDRPVGDGLITIWEGISDEIVAEMKKKYPPIDKLASASAGDKNMLPTTKQEKRDMLEKIKLQEEEDRVAGNEAVKKAEREARNPAAGSEGLPPLNDPAAIRVPTERR